MLHVSDHLSNQQTTSNIVCSNAANNLCNLDLTRENSLNRHIAVVMSRTASLRQVVSSWMYRLDAP